MLFNQTHILCQSAVELSREIVSNLANFGVKYCSMYRLVMTSTAVRTYVPRYVLGYVLIGYTVVSTCSYAVLRCNKAWHKNRGKQLRYGLSNLKIWLKIISI
jgi:hypothetical protein